MQPTRVDLLIGGHGTDLITAGAGDDTIDIYKGVIGGGTNILTDFTVSDSLILTGYSTQDVNAAVAGAVVSGGSTSITLSDSTVVTFQGLTSLNGLKIISG